MKKSKYCEIKIIEFSIWSSNPFHQNCHHGEMIPYDGEGIQICNSRNCGIFISYIEDNVKPSNEEPPQEISDNEYKKSCLNHSYLCRRDGRGKKRIIRERIIDTSKSNCEKMNEILKKLG